MALISQNFKNDTINSNAIDVKPIIVLVNRNDDSFLSPITNEDVPTKKAVPVNEVKGRVNQFHDDGSDATDIATPDFEPTSRRREPFKSIDQKCQQCGQMGSINPTHKREYYVCDKCIRSKMR